MVARDARQAKKGLGELAQLGERLVCNQEVTGSIPVFSTRVFVASLLRQEMWVTRKRLTTVFWQLNILQWVVFWPHIRGNPAFGPESKKSSEVNTWSSY
jgi:hypothetical protein